MFLLKTRDDRVSVSASGVCGIIVYGKSIGH
jgi:hypothetical protein